MLKPHDLAEDARIFGGVFIRIAAFGAFTSYCGFWTILWGVISIPFALLFHNPLISVWMMGIAFAVSALLMGWAFSFPLRDAHSTIN